MVFLQIVVTIVIVIVSHFLYIKLSRKWRNEPPGPWGLPIVGSSPFLGPRAFQAFMKYRCNYPDVSQFNFGHQRMIFLNSYETIKEALLTKGDNFSGRPKFPLIRVMQIGDGIVGSEGVVWKEHRRFALRTLRDFGFGRNRSEEIIQNEIHQLLQLLDKEIHNGNSQITIMDYLLRSVSNVICTLTMGEQPCYENEGVLKLLHRIRAILNRNSFTSPGIMFPALFKCFTPIFLLLPRIQRVIQTFGDTFKFLQVKIDEHEKDFNPSQESRDYIEAFLQEKHKLDAVDPSSHSYTPKELQREVFDLFLAGTDTTSNSLSWGLLYLAVQEDIQQKCHEEVDSTIGREKQPIMKDKEQMPYIQAVLDEIQRYATIVPMGVTHRTFTSDTIQGYHIPGDTLVVPFIYGAHHDPRVWEKPEQFYPQHFLTTSVDGKLKYKPRDELIPFSIGKRECLGESLAKMELFLFFVSILQKYEVRLPEYTKNELDDVLLGTDGPIHSPGPHQLIFNAR